MTATTNLVTGSDANLVTGPDADHVGTVTVTFTAAQADALFGLLRRASQRSYGLLIEPGVRDAWAALSAAWAGADGDTVGYARPLLLRPVNLGKGADGTDIVVCPCCSRQVNPHKPLARTRRARTDAAGDTAAEGETR